MNPFRNANLVLAFLVIIILALVPSLRADVPPTRYFVFDLGVLPGKAISNANFISTAGQAVGYSSDSTSTYNRAFLWDSVHGMQDLGVLPGKATSNANSINAQAQIVGVSSDSTGTYDRAFLWDSVHGMQDLGVLPGKSWGVAESINASSQVVGYSYNNFSDARAFLWDSVHGMQDLGTVQGGSRATAYSINAAGQAVGWSQSTNGDRAFLWDSVHGMKDLGVLPGSTNSYANSINAQAQVVGTCTDNFGNSNRAFLWPSLSGNGMQDLGVLPGNTDSYANSINAQAQVVGFSYNSTGGSRHAFLWDSVNGIQDLNSDAITDPASRAGWTLVAANSINDKGWICGSGTLNGQKHAFLLLPANVAQAFASSFTFQSAGQSVWGPGTSLNVGYFLGRQWNTGTKTIGGYYDPCTPEIDLFFFTIPSICLGNFGVQARLGTQGSAGLQFNAYANPGLANINYPVSVKLQFPNRGDTFAGDTFTVSSSYSVDSAATVSTTSPAAGAKLDAIFQANNTAHINAQAFGATLLDTDFLPSSLLNINYDQNIFDTGNLLGSNQSKDFNLPNDQTPLISGTIKAPQLNVAGGPNPNNLLAPMTATAQDTILSLNGHVTDWFSEVFGIPLSGEYKALGGDLYAGYNLLDLRAAANFSLRHDVSFVGTPHVHLDVSDGLGHATSVAWQDAVGTAHTGAAIDFNAGDAVHVTMPDPPSLTFTPTFTLGNTFTDQTTLLIHPNLSFVPFELYGGASFHGWKLGSFDIAPYHWSLGSGLLSVPLLNKSFALNNFPAHTTPPMTVSGRDHPAPVLSDVSPNTAPMFIINDNLTQEVALAQFKSAVNGSTRITLSGENFQPTGMHCFFWFYGAKLDLPIIYLTGAAIQVDLTNKVLLLPGEGRFTLTAPNTVGSSNSLDFTVQYPIPNLVKAGPSMWASDPRFLNATLSVIGNNFLDIPDYYQYNPDPDPQTGFHPHRLLQYFWTEAGFSPDMPQSFPQFDFTAVAPLPTVNWNGQQLPLFVEPDPSGLAPSLLPNALFATSNVATVTIQNPGPGGGVCPVPVTVLIGAPHPQITVLMPPGAQPGDPDLRLVVKGLSDFPSTYYDLNQPVAHGFEVGSVVNWNGNPLATTFVSATELHADVPAADLAIGAINQITVTNPVVNIDRTTTVYTSTQTAFTVANPVPTVASVYPNLLISANPGTQTGQDAPATNLTLQGTGFVPNSTVTWNGTALATTYVSATVLDAVVPATLVAQAGTATIKVVNPAPGGGSSGATIPKVWRGQALVPQAAPLPITITIQNATPGSDTFHLQITQVSPSPIPPGSGDTTILVQGSGFFSGSVVNWNGAPLKTTFISWHALQAVVPAASLTAAGSVTVVNPNSGVSGTPDGGTSNAVTVSVAIPPVVVSLRLNPIFVLGGDNVTGIVTISAPAPAGGVAISMSSSSPSAMVPAVTVPAGATSATFTVMTDPVTTYTPVTITARLGNAAVTAGLTLHGTLGAPSSYVLWNNTDGRVILWSIAQDGSFTYNVFGPYTDGSPSTPWRAAALATGPDGLSHILWTNPDGKVILWTVDDSGNFTYAAYGPYNDGSPGTLWSATALSVGSDNIVHVLWTNPDHRVILWNVNNAFHFTDAVYGPYDDGSPNTPWNATAIATGYDNVTRLVWNNPDGRVILWDVDSAFHFTLVAFGPYTDGSPSTPWSATAVSVGPDNVTRLVWNNPDHRVILWNVDPAFNFTLTAFGPYTDGSPSTPWSATALATGSDNMSHILWTNPDNRVILWDVDNLFNFTYAVYGPYTDGAPQNVWSATAISAAL